MGVLIMRALLLGVHIQAPDCKKLTYELLSIYGILDTRAVSRMNIGFYNSRIPLWTLLQMFYRIHVFWAYEKY